VTLPAAFGGLSLDGGRLVSVAFEPAGIGAE
jgi:hypothetical protein